MKVKVTDYNPEWPAMFQSEEARLKQVFLDEVIMIHHIGSTSVPGIKAKPIIDIMPLVKDINVIDRLNSRLMELGYEPMGEFGIPGRRFFRRGGDVRTHHVHVFQAGSIEIERHLAFRDYLRAHPEEAKKYGELKERLAKEFPNDIEGYIAGKDTFVKTLSLKQWNKKLWFGVIN